MTGDGRCPECGGSAQACAHADGTAAGSGPPGGGESAGGGPAGGEPAREPEDPLHIRPYVKLRESDSAQARHEAPEQAAVSAQDAHVPLPDLSPFAAHGTEETAELPAVTGSGGSRASKHRAQSSAAAPAPAAHRRMRERRRPSTAVFAGVGVAAVLGGGLLTTQLLTDDGSRTGDGRALRHMPTGAPDDDLSSPSPSAEETPERSERPQPAPSRTGASQAPRADRNGGEHTTRPSPSRSGKGRPTGRPGQPGDGQRDHGRPHPGWPGRPSGETLRPGDTGGDVVELQRRLKEAGYYDRDAPEDGVYSSRVQEAVFRYQAHYHLWDDTPGEYGPATRRHLEARTSG
ncbi:peptidoglycan-binding protein [Streptomyces sp. CA-250714]|uniref:peptidoglycan-binding domain-containing protein n=1 Tax=Streptomyces sp. CA-250714 TaxID=3240060 RepID=UPI003D922E2D